MGLQSSLIIYRCNAGGNIGHWRVSHLSLIFFFFFCFKKRMLGVGR